MKKYLVNCLMFGAFMLVLTGIPIQLLHIDSIKSAYAMGHRHKENFNNGSGNGDVNGSGNRDAHQVPDASTISLLGTGLAGIGIYVAIRRKNRK